MGWHVAPVDLFQLVTFSEGLVAQTPWLRANGSTTGALASGSVYFAAVPLISGQVITNIHLIITTQAGDDVTACKVGIYGTDGVTKVTQSLDLGDSWETTGLKTHALSEPYVVPTTGVYYFAAFATWTGTNVQLAGSSGLPTPAGIGSGKRTYAVQTAQVDLPATAVPATNTLRIWAGAS